MGDNGAGKSTLVKVIADNFPPTHSEVRIGGEVVHFHKPVEARQKGVEVVYQDLALCNNLSAAANVFLGREIKRALGPLKWLDHSAMARKAGELFKELKFRRVAPRRSAAPAGQNVSGMGGSEIARAAAHIATAGRSR